jgi:apolipoprotein N-acyltransferase
MSTKQKFLNYFLTFFAGTLYAAGFPIKGVSLSLPFLSFLGMGYLLYQITDIKNPRSFRSNLLTILVFNVGYCLMGYYWIAYTMKEFGEIPFPFNYLVSLSFSLIITPHLFIFLGHTHKKLRGLLNILEAKGLTVVALAFVMSLLEYFVPQQFPAHLGHVWLSFAPYIPFAAIFGAPFYSFISYALIFYVIKGLRTKSWSKFAPALYLAPVVYGLIFPIKNFQERTNEKEMIRLVQPNIGNYAKVLSESGDLTTTDQILERFFDLSTRPSKEKIDLIIWPETAYPRLLHSEALRESSGITPEIFQRVILKTGASLITGGYDYRQEDTGNHFESEYNAAFYFDQNFKLSDVYHKMKLIPFGESLPFGPFNKLIGSYIDNISFFGQGQNYTLFNSVTERGFITAICYEILFSSFIRDYLNNIKRPAHYMINFTNDSWYGDSSEPYQHLFLAHWRSLEFDLPIIRSTNTGVTSVLYPDGSESTRIPIFKEGTLDLAMPILKKPMPSFFQKFGIWGLFIPFTIALGVSLLSKGRES